MTKAYKDMTDTEKAAYIAELDSNRVAAGIKNALFTIVRQYDITDNADGSRSARFRVVTYIDHKPVYFGASAYIRPDHPAQENYFKQLTQGSRWSIDYKPSNKDGFIDIFRAFPRPRKAEPAA
ncbi:hypothetical protein [Lacticaseibacillus jixiensis]|uniref:hypothetical protein n=1 Tax=Lacticaseibacillus jixiensis TaxID=3231926 RepID=UPI0036F3F534